MSELIKNQEHSQTQDVVICGGGMSGLLLARQLRRELPELSVTVIERSTRPLPDACHKVGESSVELGSQYLERLGLLDYLLEKHIIKLGLRFFPGGGKQPLAERTEIGPSAEPIVRSFQLDRGRFETDMRGFIEEDGATLIEGGRVTGIDLSETEDHTLTYELDGTEHTLRARWVIDAMGRTAFLRRKMKSTRGLQHSANAGWFRVSGRVDINDMVPASETEWHERAKGDERWRSTNHFMGDGYWAWVIPLSTGNTSIGLVVHDDVHGHKCISSYEAMTAFLEEHEPHLAALLKAYEPNDYLALRNFSNSVGRAWSSERWAMVGEAGAFVDPLYSPGNDFIALANCFTTELLRVDFAGGDTEAKAQQLNGHYRGMVIGAVQLFRNAAPIYGHPSAMATKVFWDNFSYWSYTCQFYKQNLCQLSNEEHMPFGVIGQRLLILGGQMQKLLTAWADLKPEGQQAKFIGAPHFPSVLIDAHIQVGEEMSTDELLELLQMRLAQAEEMAGEIVLRIVQILGPDLGREALERAKFSVWGIKISPERIEAESRIGMSRRKSMSIIARDTERTLGKIPKHPQAEEARELLTQAIPS